MEIIASVIFVVAVVGIVLFVKAKNKQKAEARAKSNAEWDKQQAAEWAVSELNPDSPFFNQAKYDELQAKLKEQGLA